MSRLWPMWMMLVWAWAVAPESSPSQQIAFTWDDLPVHSALPPGETRAEIGRKIIQAMKEAHMPPAYGFANGVQAEAEPPSVTMLKEWKEAGLPIGNHTWSHMNLNTSSLTDWENDVLKNEGLLQSYANWDWRWLRYPNLAEGDSNDKRIEARRFLKEHGYRIAGVTMSFGDYLYNGPYARCVGNHDDASVAQLEASYLAAADATAEYTRAMSKALFGRDIPYVLLMHVGALDAQMLPRLLKLYQNKGFSFLTLEDAEKDAFYRNDLDLSLPPVPDTLEEGMRERHLPLPARPRPTVDLNNICR